jgi:hypothetical protein
MVELLEFIALSLRVFPHQGRSGIGASDIVGETSCRG